MDPGPPASLQLGRTRLAFVDPVTERAFRRHLAGISLPFVRLGLVFSAIAWSIGLWLFAVAFPAQLGPFARSLATTLGPVILLVFVASFVRRFRGVLPWLAWGSNVAAGFFTIHLVSLLRSWLGGAGLLVLVMSFGLHFLRLRTLPALAAVLLYAGAFQAAAWQAFAAGELPVAELVQASALVWLALLLGLPVTYTLELVTRQAFLQARVIDAQLAELDEARRRSDRLLENTLPARIAQRLRRDSLEIADHHAAVTILFADIVDFTPIAERLAPGELVALLDRVFSRFDQLADQHGVEKIKTIGDAYMIAAGVPDPRADHAEAAAEMALDMMAALRELAPSLPRPLTMRIGLYSGPVVAGVIGKRKFAYDLWGDAVNAAARLESHGIAGEIQVGAPTFALLRERYQLVPRGPIEVKGKGVMEVYLLRGRRVE